MNLLSLASHITRPLSTYKKIRSRILDAKILKELEELDPGFIELAKVCTRYSLTGTLRLYALHKAMAYVSKRKIPGSFVECGVWKGGSSMMAAMSLMNLGDTSKDLYLYDTFEGMSPPSEFDKDRDGVAAGDKLKVRGYADFSDWCRAGIDEVARNMKLTGYPEDKIHLIAGKVEDTLPGTSPKEISVLRLDTDWYESSKHELIHLYPLLSPGGVLIIDDYGHWQGCRRAVDEYFSEMVEFPLLSRVDYSCRVGIKV